jgi:two-component system chemotaxis response regulator CheY
MRSLVVDDDAFSRELHKEILISICDCDVASNGEEAVCLFSKALTDMNPYHLILMDVSMPIYNGHYALSKIRAIEKERGIETCSQVKVIILSASNDPKTVMESYYKGGSSYLVKPVTKSRLLQVLKNFHLVS